MASMITKSSVGVDAMFLFARGELRVLIMDNRVVAKEHKLPVSCDSIVEDVYTSPERSRQKPLDR